MGDLRFKLANTERFDPLVWQTAYITGLEGIPWHCYSKTTAEQFSIGREIDESGKLNIVWPTHSSGNLCLSTTSLRIRSEPYALPVELARGSVSRLKGQTAEWQRMGLKLPDHFFTLAEQALEQFLHSVTLSADSISQDRTAQLAIEYSTQASCLLCDAFANQALEARRANEGRLSMLLGVTLQPELPLDRIADALSRAFNIANVQPDLGSVEQSSGRKNFDPFDQQMNWLANQSTKACVGPLVDFRQGGLPTWMTLLDEGFESVLETACQHALNAVERYRGQTHIWNCAAGLNAPNGLGWSDEEVLRMAVSLIETVRQADDRTPVLLTIDQPWAEYLRDDANGISPLHFADALIRADLGLSGLALKLNFDQWPGGCLPRDLIEISRLIDRWAMLGLPLMISLSAPTQSAQQPDSNRVSGWKFDTRDYTASHDDSVGTLGVVSPESILRLLTSKPSIHAIIWEQVSDQLPRHTNSSGLWDQQGKPKTLLSSMAQLRKTYLH